MNIVGNPSAVRIHYSTLSSFMAEESFAREARIESKLVLLVLSEPSAQASDVIQNFCGNVITNITSLPDLSSRTVYLCGDIALADAVDLSFAGEVLVIADISTSYEERSYRVVDSGQVPLLVHGVGVYYRRFFEPNNFHRICADHTLQTLTESDKPATALRTGIYLTPVQQVDEEYHFRLLRCSSNLSGPTGNFSVNDHAIVSSLNQAAQSIFSHHAPLNHVLAQVYHNTAATESQKQAKAKIKAHADKTKDMPHTAIMAFCTFYDNLHLQHMGPQHPFDYGHKGISGLTRLHFRLKKPVAEREHCNLKREFSVTLYPDSAFFIPLSTNRLYTHEIRPSQLDAALLPTRLGYVVRCSSTEAVHKRGVTYIKANDDLVPLHTPSAEEMHQLRALYARENATEEVIHYGPIYFSMNNGDFEQPLMTEAFRSYAIPLQQNPFDELQHSVRMEPVCAGRAGGILVLQDTRGTPIVRTTTKYHTPAQYFQLCHKHLSQQISQIASTLHPFNNAMIEKYTNKYSTMGFHSDQALDLADGSSIAIFSCYKYPELVATPRKLVIMSKDDNRYGVTVPLLHNSAVIFTADTNRLYKHKIVLDVSPDMPENEWLGITFRTSKTFVHARDGVVYGEDGSQISLATEDQCKEFYKLRRRENEETNFKYPALAYTISESDLMEPVSL